MGIFNIFGSLLELKSRLSSLEIEVEALRKGHKNLSNDYDTLSLRFKATFEDNLRTISELKEKILKKAQYLDQKGESFNLKDLAKQKIAQRLGLLPKTLRIRDTCTTSNESIDKESGT